MKWLASIIIWMSLCVGLVAAITAYVPPLDSIDPTDELALNAPAGKDNATPPAPLLNPSPTSEVVLTAENLKQLRSAGVQRVRVKQFAFGRWTHKWMFAVACAGLLLGAWLVRREDKAVAVAITGPLQTGVSSPREMLEQARDDVRRLIADIDGAANDQQRCEVTLRRVAHIQATYFAPFVESRPQLIGRLGLGGFASVMDRFAAAERQISRAWSAAADRVPAESRESLANGLIALDEAIERLR